MPEKRLKDRKRKRLKVRFGLDQPKKIAFTDDISSKGIFVTTVAPERPGTILNLLIEIPDGNIIRCQGQVRWARRVPRNLLRVASKGGMGLTLGNFTEGKEHYQRMVEELRY